MSDHASRLEFGFYFFNFDMRQFFTLQAVGNWDGQKPVFRGCAGAFYEHGSSCKREMQTVEVVPGKPKVYLL